MAGEAGSLGRAFVEIHVPQAAFQSQMTAIGTTFVSQTSRMIAEAQLVSAAIASANTGIISSYNAVAASVMGLLTAQELAFLSTNNLSLALHHGDVAARSMAAGGVVLATGMGAAATGTQGLTLSLSGLMAMAKSMLPLMAAFMAVTKTIGIAGGAVESQREFNKELYQLWTLTDLTTQGIEDLGDEIRGLTHDYNVFAGAGTRAMYQIYSAVFVGAEATEIFESGMKAAAAGVTDVLSAVDMATTVLNAYGMASSEVTRVNDLLFTAVRFGKTTFEELAGQFGRLAGVAAPAGARLEEMTAAIATLTRQGIMTDWAVTSLRQTIMQMFRPTGKLAQVIKDLGYETGRALIQENGFAGALKLVKERADEIGMPLENMFTNVRAITAVLPLLTTASVGFAADLERMSMASGAMDIAFQKVAQSWDYRIERLKSQLNDLSISIGEMLIPAVEAFLEVWANLGAGIEGVIDLLGPFGEMISEATGYMTAGATAAGLLAGGIWLVYKAIMALLAHPVIAGLVALGAVIGAIVARTADLASEAREARKELEKYRELQVSGATDPEQLTPRQYQNMQERAQSIILSMSEAFTKAETERLRLWSDIAADPGARVPRAGLPGAAEIFPLAGVERVSSELTSLAEALKDEVYLVSTAVLEYFGYTIEQLRDYGLVVEEGMGQLTAISPEDTIASAWDWVSGMLIKVTESAAKLDPTNVEASLEGYAELEDYLEEAEEALDMFIARGWEGIPMLEELKETIEALIGVESTFAAETEILIKAFGLAKDGSIAQAEILDELTGRYATLTGWVKTLSDVEKEANSEIIDLIESLEALGIMAKKNAEEIDALTGTLVSLLSGIAGKYGGPLGGDLGAVISAAGPLITQGFGGTEAPVGAGWALLGSVVPLALSTIAWAWDEYVTKPTAEKTAEEEEALDNMLAASDAVVSSFWSLVESAESVAEIQSGLAQLQVSIMTALLGFLWPLAGILEAINELFVLQAEVVEKEIEVRQKMLGNLNVPIGFPINRIRFAAGTPGEPVEWAGQYEPEADEEVAALLEWWQEALEPFRNEILAMIQPIAEFRDSMRELWIDLIPSILGAIEPVVATFAWTLGQIDTWMHDVFAPDLEEFAKGFRDFWTERVDPWWTEEVWPQIGEWLDTIYGWLGAIVDFFSDEGWTFLSEDVWGAVKPFVKAVLDMFQEFGEWVEANWDDISENLLKKLGEVLGDITGDLDTVLTNIKAWLLGTDIDEDEMTDWQWLMSAISWAMDLLRQATESAAAAIQFLANVIGQIFNVFIGAFNLFTGVLNAMFWWAGVEIPSIPYFQWQELGAGGIAMEAMPAIIGDVPEAIIPLNQLSRMLSVQPGAAGMTGFGGIGTPGGIGASAVTINVNLSQQRLNTIMLREMTSQNVNDSGVGFAPIRVG